MLNLCNLLLPGTDQKSGIKKTQKPKMTSKSSRQATFMPTHTRTHVSSFTALLYWKVECIKIQRWTLHHQQWKLQFLQPGLSWLPGDISSRCHQYINKTSRAEYSPILSHAPTHMHTPSNKTVCTYTCNCKMCPAVTCKDNNGHGYEHKQSFLPQSNASMCHENFMLYIMST